MNKTYFNFEQQMASKDLVEAISIPHGIGPFCGFGGHKLSPDGTTLIITSEPSNGNSIAADGPFYNLFYNSIHDRIKARNIYKGSDDPATNFGCISRDGYIWTSSEETIEIPIEGSQGVSPDIIVVAVHAPLEEAVENPVEFRAFWSQSSNGFYDLYRRSIDPGYPKATLNRDLNVMDENDPYMNSSLTFDNLETTLIGALPSGVWSPDTMCIIGVYGSGNNALNDGAIENYRIIPYDSKFPMVLNHTTAERGLIRAVLEKLLTLTSGVPSNYNNIIDYIISTIKGGGSSTVINNNTSAMPKGSIIMWYGSQKTIPAGWELCDGGVSVNDPALTKPNLMGRVPVGLSTAAGDYSNVADLGGNDSITLKEDQMPRHRHRIGLGQAKWGDNASKRNFIKFGGNNGDGDYQDDSEWRGKNYTDYVGGDASGRTNPIDIRQSYCVVAFIIKTVD